MAKQIHKDGSIVGHVWERAELGIAPYAFIGIEEKAISYPDGTSQAGGTCQYCGTGIRYCYWILSADKKKFYVGSDCVAHLDDEKLVAVVMSAERRRKNDLAAERRRIKRIAEEKTRAEEVDRLLPEYLAAVKALESRPHPTEYFAAQGKTLADYFRYFERAGKPSFWKMKEAIDKAAES